METTKRHKRKIQTFVLRSGRMTISQKRNYQLHSKTWCIPFKKEIINLDSLFAKRQSLIVEIGFGMGQATAIIAQENPQNNYLGIEVFQPGVGKLLNEIEQRQLKNIKIIEYDALSVLKYMIPDNSITAFHIFFPDPWPKKKHHKRRLMQRPHIDLIVQKLVENGYIYMVTDWEPYAEFAFLELKKTASLVSAYDGYAPPQTWRPQTKFEKKGKKENRTIRELFFLKQKEG